MSLTAKVVCLASQRCDGIVVWYYNVWFEGKMP